MGPRVETVDRRGGSDDGARGGRDRVAVSGNMNAQISDVRADIRQIPDSVDRLDRRLDDVEKGITGMQVKIDLLLPEPAAD